MHVEFPEFVGIDPSGLGKCDSRRYVTCKTAVGPPHCCSSDLDAQVRSRDALFPREDTLQAGSARLQVGISLCGSYKNH